MSPKAWRVAERDLVSFMKGQNVSELLFEEYLAENDLSGAEHEPSYPRSGKRIDYRLPFHGKPLWFEVKEFDDDPKLHGSRGGAFDPYAPIRLKIAKASAKFRDYDGECCSLVLFNERFNLVHIGSPQTVLGAMHGNVGFSIPVDLETGQEAGPTTNIFGSGAKFRHDVNTTISAVIALERLAIGQREFKIAVELKEREEKRELSLEEYMEFQRSDDQRFFRQVLCVSVYENPHAANPLPRDIFVGPFDKRWGQVEEFVKPLYVGPELQKLLETEHELELDNPLRRLLRKKSRREK